MHIPMFPVNLENYFGILKLHYCKFCFPIIENYFFIIAEQYYHKKGSYDNHLHFPEAWKIMHSHINAVGSIFESKISSYVTFHLF